MLNDLRRTVGKDTRVLCVTCDWCGLARRTIRLKSLVEIEDRVEAGDEIPVGLCPKCHDICRIAPLPDTLRRFAKVSWTVGDLQTLMPNWSDDKAAEWLLAHEKHICSRLVELGWDVIRDVLSFGGHHPK